jgi:hypothetical protein
MSAYRIIVQLEPYDCHYAASYTPMGAGSDWRLAFIILAQLIGLAIPVSILSRISTILDQAARLAANWRFLADLGATMEAWALGLLPTTAMAPLLLRDRARGGTHAVAMVQVTAPLRTLPGRGDGANAVAAKTAAAPAPIARAKRAIARIAHPVINADIYGISV